MPGRRTKAEGLARPEGAGGPAPAKPQRGPRSPGASPPHSPSPGGSPGGASARGSQGSPCSPARRSSLAQAVAKAEARREQTNQVQEDLRRGAELNALFRNPENRRDPETLQRFWAEIKARLLRRHGSIQAAFRALDTSGDSSMSFIEFGDMLRQIHLPLDQRVCRAVFDKAAGGDRALSLEELQGILLEGTIRKLRALMSGFDAKQERVQLHIHHFLRRLAQADERSRTRGVDRFQRKLTVAFAREFWRLLLGGLGKTRAQNVAVDRPTVLRASWGLVAARRFQAYEVAFMLRIFERVDSHRHRSVSLASLITTLLLLSSEQGHTDKLALLFEIFDTDYDGCLQFDQILAMFRCICKHRPIAEVASSSAHDQAFQEELSGQEGQRAYERAHWYLQRSSKVEGGVVSMGELLSALERRPEILEDLMPGTVRLRWLLEARPRSAFGYLGADGKQLLPLWMAPQRPLTESLDGSRRKTTFQRSRSDAARAGSKTRFLPTPPLPPGSAGRMATPDLRECSEATRFKKTVTWNFKRSLRSLGDLRLSELNAGEGGRCEEAHAQRGPGRRRPGSRPSSGDLGRVRSAPSLARQQALRRASSHAHTAPAGARGHSHGHAGGGPRSTTEQPLAEVPAVSPDKWGSEAAERFRLFSTISSSFGRCDALAAATPSGNIGYRCQLCRREHLLTASPE